MEYEIQVLDKFSANLKKFDDLIAKTQKSLKSFNSSFTASSKNFAIFQKNIKSNVSHLDILHRSLNKTSVAADIFSRKLSKLNGIDLSGAVSQLNKLSVAMNKASMGGFGGYSGTATKRARKPNFIMSGGAYGGFQGVSADLFRYQKSMRNALAPYTNPYQLDLYRKGVQMGGSYSNFKPIDVAQLRSQMAYNRSMRNALMVVNRDVVPRGSAFGKESFYNPRSYIPNFTMPIDSSYRMTSGSRAVVPYGYGRVGGVPSRMYPMKDVTPQYVDDWEAKNREYNQRNNPARQPSQPSQPSQQPRSPVFGGSGLGSFGGMARAMGYYEAINMGMKFPRTVYSNLKTTRGIEASLDAFKKIGIAPDLKSSKEELSDIMGIADKYGVRFSSIIDPYRKILATKKLSPDVTKKLMSGLSAYSNVVGMDNEAQSGTFLAIEQMLTQGNIKGQEFNLQLQRAPGLRELFFQAFKRATDVQGIPGVKGTITKENMASKFIEYREKGLMDSPIIMKHLAEILMEPMLQKMGIAKGHMVQGEENRLSNAYFRASTSVGNVVEMPIIKALTITANLFDILGQKINIFGQSLSIWADWYRSKDERPTLAKGLAEGSMKAIKSVANFPLYAGRLGYDLGMTPIKALEGATTGDWSDYDKYKSKRNAYWFNGADFNDPASISALKALNTDDYLATGGLKYSRIPKSSQPSQEQVIKVILEGKNMPANMTATVENYGAKSTTMRVENNVGGY
jgi:tape measure domain-containing protein